jgi:hypothetical protein
VICDMPLHVVATEIFGRIVECQWCNLLRAVWPFRRIADPRNQGAFRCYHTSLCRCAYGPIKVDGRWPCTLKSWSRELGGFRESASRDVRVNRLPCLASLPVTCAWRMFFRFSR